MTCWPGSHDKAGTTPPFEERVWREARRLCPHGVPAALLLVRPLPAPPLPAPTDSSLAPLARLLRRLLRRSDAMVMEAGRGIAVVLVGTDQQGARLVAARLHAGCAALASTPGVPTRMTTLGIGFSELTPLRPLDRWHADGALRAAERPRVSLRVPCPIANIADVAPAATEREAELAEIGAAPRPRVIRFGGRRRDERLPTLAAREARRLAVGAPIAPTTPLALADDALSARVLTLTTSISAHAAGVVEVADQRDRLRLRALSLGVPFLHLPPTLPADCAGALSVELARELRAVPVGRTATALTIALDSRWDARMLFRLRAATGLEIFPVLTLSDELERALGQLTRES